MQLKTQFYWVIVTYKLLFLLFHFSTISFFKYLSAPFKRMTVKNMSPKLSPPMILKQEITTEEVEEKAIKLPDSIDKKRYVHENPREFKGRLGYACLNTVLRSQKPTVFCSRTCRLSKAMESGVEFLQELSFQNIADLKKLVQWNEDNNIKFMRVSSNVFPFGTHEKAGYPIDFAKDALAEVGALANKYNHRLTTHPGQFNQLVSLTPKVVENTVRELEHHAHMLDLMGMDQDSIMIIHMGGVYGDRASAIARFEKEYAKLPENVKRRLVLENDELGYSVSDLLPVCQKLGVPLVLDWHHHYINPGNITDLVSLLPAINKIWTDKGIKPKQHYSESRRGATTLMELRAHSDRVKNLPPTTDDVDLMIEAKDKEQAVFELYKLYGLKPVNEESYVPVQGIETTQTKGRKSNKRATKKAQKLSKKEEDTESEGETDTKEVAPVTSTRRSQRKTAVKNYREHGEENDNLKEEVFKEIKSEVNEPEESLLSIAQETTKPMKKGRRTEVVKSEPIESKVETKPKRKTREKKVDTAESASDVKIEDSESLEMSLIADNMKVSPERKRRARNTKTVENDSGIKIESDLEIAAIEALKEEPVSKAQRKTRAKKVNVANDEVTAQKGENLVQLLKVGEKNGIEPERKTREKRAKTCDNDTVSEETSVKAKRTPRKRSKKE